jgi:spermidine synthase
MTETAKERLQLWVGEHHQENLRMQYRVKETLFSGESEFQQIDVVETVGYGKMLFNDSIAMLSERDEFVYHDMIAHVALYTHPNVRRVLVIGGGDGGTVREVLRHKCVESVHLVEIDPLVVESCREHIPLTAAALDDPRATVTIADGVEFVAKTDERFDLVIVDSTDPIGPATPLFGTDFYGNVRRVLNDDGIVVSQAESPFYEQDRQRSLLEILGQRFDQTYLYNYVNLTYPGGLWSFSMATSGGRCPIADFDIERLRKDALPFEYYSEGIHRAAFTLPAFQVRDLEGLLTPFRDGAVE